MSTFDSHQIPVAHGAYVLHFATARWQKIVIGHLGEQYLAAGHYFYVGSARGAGGLQARVGRHLRSAGALHWHIDYVRAVAEVQNVFYTVTDKSLECAWSQALARLPAALIPVPHFGASDCRSGCAAHLIAFPHRADITGVPHALAAITPTPIDSLRPTDSRLW